MSININLNGATGFGTTYSTAPTPVYLFPTATFDATSSDNNAVDSVTIALGTHTSSMTLALDAATATFAANNGVTYAYNSVTGELSLNGTNKSDTIWQTILRGVTFTDSSPTPTDPVSVTITAKNGSHTGTDTQYLQLDPPPSNFVAHTDADSFSSSSYGLNTGTDNWAGNWTESDTTATSPNSGDIQISSGELRFGDSDNQINSITREASANLAYATSATLSFDYTSNTSSSDEYLTVQISTDGTNWSNVGTVGASGTGGHFTASISNDISASTYIRFEVPGTLDNHEYIYVDNVTLSYTGVAKQTVNWETNPHILFNSANNNQIKVSDLNDANLTVTLSVAHGTLTLSGTTGLSSVSGDGSSTVTIAGSLNDLNAALNGLDYHTASTDVTIGNVDDTLTITSSDGHTGGTTTNTVQIDCICFYPGTLIRTPNGDAKVETLKRGDLVVTNDGRTLPVSWLGRQSVSMVFADPLRVQPIRVKAGALGESVPSRDLLVSPDHAILIDGVLVQAGALVNGTSIVREANVPRVFTYYHVEVEDHSLILAENAPAETFIDNVDRMNFDNWAEYQALYPEGKVIDELPYPRAKSHRQVPIATRVKLGERAEVIGVVSNVVAA